MQHTQEISEKRQRRERLYELEKRVEFVRGYEKTVVPPARAHLLRHHVNLADEATEKLVAMHAATGDVASSSMDVLEETVQRAERVQHCLQLVCAY